MNRVEKEWSEMVMPVECNMGLDEWKMPVRGSNRITQNWRLEWKESGKAAT